MKSLDTLFNNCVGSSYENRCGQGTGRDQKKG